MDTKKIYEKALKYQFEERLDEAIETFNSLPETASEYAEAMIDCARIYSYLDRNKDAINT